MAKAGGLSGEDGDAGLSGHGDVFIERAVARGLGSLRVIDPTAPPAEVPSELSLNLGDIEITTWRC
jgi:hypothetical protein